VNGQTLARLLLCTVLGSGLLRQPLLAQTYVAEPPVNLGDTSFLDGIAGPGFVLEQIADGAHDGRIVGATGNTVHGTGSVNGISGLTHLAWLSHQRIDGGWYGLEVVGTAADVDAGALRRADGVGALMVSPFILQWPEHRLLHMPVEQRVTLDFGLPVGGYSRSSGVNIGTNTFTVNPYYAITAHPAKRIETSWRVHYLWNSTNNAPPLSTGASSTQAGQAIHFNATAGYSIYKGLWIGPNAYFLSQITDGRVNGLSIPDSPERVAAIGPGMVWNRKKWFFYANQYEEFGARNRATGQKLVLRVEKVF
jgi:hypothetical protein